MNEVTEFRNQTVTLIEDTGLFDGVESNKQDPYTDSDDGGAYVYFGNDYSVVNIDSDSQELTDTLTVQIPQSNNKDESPLEQCDEYVTGIRNVIKKSNFNGFDGLLVEFTGSDNEEDLTGKVRKVMQSITFNIVFCVDNA